MDSNLINENRINAIRHVRLFFSIVLSVLVTVAVFIAIIDPAFHYHAPLAGFSYLLNKERFQNDGIIKHFDYDAMITGTSMAENCSKTQIDELFGVNSIKTCYMGATYRELGESIDVALKYNPDIKLVIRAVDLSGLIAEPEAHISNDKNSEYEFPLYMYDTNPFNDVKYLFSHKMLEYAIQDLTMTINGQEGTTFDEYSNWNDKYLYGKEYVINSYERPDYSSEVQLFSPEDEEMVEGNVRINIIDTARNNPEVDFYIWIPPYSICYYDVERQKGELPRILDALEYALHMLVEVENIKTYCFVDRTDISTNLSLYKDMAHYNENVNCELVEMMANGQGLITADNCSEYMSTVRDFYMNFDYDGLYEQ